jgi:hypothetical protein
VPTTARLPDGETAMQVGLPQEEGRGSEETSWVPSAVFLFEIATNSKKNELRHSIELRAQPTALAFPPEEVRRQVTRKGRETPEQTHRALTISPLSTLYRGTLPVRDCDKLEEERVEALDRVEGAADGVGVPA